MLYVNMKAVAFLMNTNQIVGTMWTKQNMPAQRKKRILMQLKPPGSENAIIDNYVPIFIPGEYKIVKFDKDGNPIYQEEEDSVKRKPKHA